MAKPKKKPTPAEKEAKKRRKRDFEFVLIGGKQRRVRRRTIEGMDTDEFIRCNADPNSVGVQKVRV